MSQENPILRDLFNQLPQSSRMAFLEELLTTLSPQTRRELYNRVEAKSQNELPAQKAPQIQASDPLEAVSQIRKLSGPNSRNLSNKDQVAEEEFKRIITMAPQQEESLTRGDALAASAGFMGLVLVFIAIMVGSAFYMEQLWRWLKGLLGF